MSKLKQKQKVDVSGTVYRFKDPRNDTISVPLKRQTVIPNLVGENSVRFIPVISSSRVSLVSLSSAFFAPKMASEWSTLPRKYYLMVVVTAT